MAKLMTDEEAKQYMPPPVTQEAMCSVMHTDDTCESSTSGADDFLAMSVEERLRLGYALYAETTRFKPGQLVCWKPLMQNRSIPVDEEPAVVISHLKKPVISPDNESGSPFYREELDLIIGVLDEEYNFLRFYVDSHRFERWQADSENQTSTAPNSKSGNEKEFKYGQEETIRTVEGQFAGILLHAAIPGL